ncbi:MAG: tRNA-intron lyase [Candidatus Hodarchaeales archaeon]
MNISTKPRAELIGSRVIVWDTDEAKILYADGFFGKPVGIKKPKSMDFTRPLELSLLESLYLLEQEKIELYDSTSKEKLGPVDFSNKCDFLFKNFRDLYTVYKHLRSKNYVVRSGLKFGTDFTIYKQGPGIDHAAFLVQVVVSNSKLEAIHLVRAGRLATSVKKRYVIATVLKNEDVRYYIFKWHKP